MRWWRSASPSSSSTGSPRIRRHRSSRYDPSRSEPVRIDVCDVSFPLTRATDPLWRRMAARTTSRGGEDQLRRWLNGRGYADGVSAGSVLGIPFLGALIFQRRRRRVRARQRRTQSILTQLQRCGAIDDVRRTDACPEDAERAHGGSPRTTRRIRSPPSAPRTTPSTRVRYRRSRGCDEQHFDPAVVRGDDHRRLRLRRRHVHRALHAAWHGRRLVRGGGGLLLGARRSPTRRSAARGCWPSPVR